MWHIKYLTNFTQKALNDTTQGISILKSKVEMMRSAVPQNRLESDVLSAAQRGICDLFDHKD
jgi:hypothetical protein